MKALSAEENKQVALDILKDIARFCDKHGLRYSLCGGTLLGAVRHKGFIPWDDDIDIMMPRPDYEQFMATYNNPGQRYQAHAIENDPDWYRHLGQVLDMDTILDDRSMRAQKNPFRLFVDIFPLDGVPDSITERRRLFRKEKLYHAVYGGSIYNYVSSLRYVDSKDSWAGLKGKVRTVLKFAAISVFKHLSTQNIVRKMNDLARQYDYAKCDKIAAVTACRYEGEKEVMPREMFEDMVKMTFEDAEFSCMGCWEQYLSNLYGDYMKLPPVSAQVPHHDFTVYWK